MRVLRRLRRRAERGEGSLVELIGVIVILVALLDIAVCIVIARPAQVAAAGASRACARMAVDTLDAGLGYAQGQAAAFEYLMRAGVAAPSASGAVAPARAGGNTRVTLNNGWARWGTVACTVEVDVPTGAIGIMRRIVGAPTLTITQSTTLTDGAWQSRW
ncbi:MAG: hypothetical protein Kow00120_19180 [Anaerolineae bacterium]